MESLSRREFLGTVAGAAGALGAASVGSSGRAMAADASADATRLISKAVALLRSRQAEDGSWSVDRGEPGITALVAAGLLRSGQVPPADRAAARALSYLEGFIGPDGGLSKARHSNYATSVALMAFHDANQGGRYDATIKAAQGFLRATQFDESNGTTRDNPYFGGAGYGAGSGPPPPARTGGDAPKAKAAPRAPRPDLSNTAFMIEALRDSGLPADDPALQEGAGLRLALPEPQERVQRPALGGQGQRRRLHLHRGQRRHRASPARPRTAACAPTRSMTYAGLKSMIYAGLTQDDPRVKAALDYIRKTLHARREPRAWASAGLLLLPGLRQGPVGARRSPRSWTPPASEPRLAGRPDRRPGEASRARTGAGSTRPTASWKATPTS